jgi:3-dehydroquinate synthase
MIDRNVATLYQEQFDKAFKEHEIILFDAIEENKTLDYASVLIEQIIAKAAKKNLTIISIGGGITQDLTGFIASTLYRGVNWIFVPTTFLAQTDSCIGNILSTVQNLYQSRFFTNTYPS